MKAIQAMHQPIMTSHMRLALVLREALAEPDHDKIVGDAKELILAARKIHTADYDRFAIVKRLSDLLDPYGMSPNLDLSPTLLSLRDDLTGYLRAVPL